MAPITRTVNPGSTMMVRPLTPTGPLTHRLLDQLTVTCGKGTAGGLIKMVELSYRMNYAGLWNMNWYWGTSDEQHQIGLLSFVVVL